MLPLAAIGAAFVVDGWPARRFLALYVAPLLLAAPLWVSLRLDAIDVRPSRSPSTWLDAGIFVLAFLRFVLGELLPFSGHMLFLAYSGLTTRERWYRALALVLLVETTAFKLWLWRDPTSWGLGLALGVAAALVRLRVSAPPSRLPNR